MAPAIAHFLVGASLLLLVVTPVALRYEIGRENAIWLVPIGGICGLIPDIHHIAPAYESGLYALHDTPWVDLFAFHYTLDRPAIRARYLESVFGAIALFTGSVAIFWGGDRVRAANTGARTSGERLLVSLVAVGFAAGYATVAAGVVVRIQGAFPSVAALVGSNSVLVGGVLFVVIGVGLGGFYGIAFGALTFLEYVSKPPTAAMIGCAFGVMSWIGGVVVLLPSWLQFVTDSAGSIPFVHWGSLVVLAVYGTVFGGVYEQISGVFSPAISGAGDET